MKSKKFQELQNEEPAEEKAARASLIAQKNFTIHQNGYVRHIKAGDDLSDVPETYHQNLRTEGVLKDSKDS